MQHRKVAVMVEIGTLILLRHGRSEWNETNLFTGWVDVRLSAGGRSQAATCGRLLTRDGLLPDIVHTSVLVRAIETANVLLSEMDRLWIPASRSWRLNERHYGALQGRNKAETLAAYGEVHTLLPAIVLLYATFRDKSPVYRDATYTLDNWVALLTPEFAQLLASTALLGVTC